AAGRIGQLPVVIAPAHRQIPQPGGSKAPVFGQGTAQLTVIDSVGRHSHAFRLTKPPVLIPGPVAHVGTASPADHVCPWGSALSAPRANTAAVAISTATATPKTMSGTVLSGV